MNIQPAAEAAPNPTPKPATPYQDFINLLGSYSDTSHKIEALKLRLSARVLDGAEKVKDTFTELNETLSAVSAKIEELCRSNPAWFAKAKTIKTPFGQVGMKSVTDLIVLDEATTLRLLERERERSRARRAEQERTGAPVEAEFDPELYLRRDVALNKEALEALDDATLARLGISREQRQSFSLKASEFDLGQLGKAAKEGSAG